MIHKRAASDGLEEIQAQYLGCGHLTRACRQALFEIALDEEDEPAVRRRAVQQQDGDARRFGRRRRLRRLSQRQSGPSLAARQ